MTARGGRVGGGGIEQKGKRLMDMDNKCGEGSIRCLNGNGKI